MRLAWSVLALWVCVGCGAVQKPTATVKSMSLGEINPQGFTMNFAVDVTNPNAFELPVSGLDYGLALSGTKLLDGSTKPGGGIPANGSRSLTLPVNVSFEKLLSAGEAVYKSGGDIPYALDGGFELAGDLTALRTPVRVPVSYSGTLKLREILKDPLLLLRSPAAKQLAEKVLGSVLGR